MRSCPACGTANPETSKFCAECGGRLPAGAEDREQRKTVTVLFSDVTGSTALGEQLEPESLRRMLARFFEAAREVIESHGGTVEKFIGDAVMAVFGVPVVHEDDALRALRAALDLMSALDSLNPQLEHEHGATLRIRIGVNTGEVVTGTSERLATGDAVNVAARLEQLAHPGEIYVGEVTAQLAGPSGTFEELEPATLKGKTAPSRVFRLLSVGGTERPTTATPMVGRKRQLEMLRGAFDQAVEDRACVLFTVLGAAGVGKSRLVAEFLAGLDATVVRGRCLSYGAGVGLWPAVEIVQQLQADAAGPVTALLERDEAFASVLRTLVDGEGTVTSPVEIAWAVRRLLEECAARRPLVVVLDDLHWAEESLFEVVEHVVTLSRDAPILVLAMARPELLERRQGWGGGALNAATALLEPLGPEETAELVDLLSASLDDAAREQVRRAAAGNPLFAEEMVALLEASGGKDVRVPPTIQALLAARLDQLDPAELRALECGSVEGQSFHRGALSALDTDDPELPQRLLGLVRKDLLRPDRPSLDRDEAFRFRHLLLRDAAYDRLPKSARADLHERLARWLEEQADQVAERYQLVGHHLEQAYRYRAGLGPIDAATQRLAREAAARFERAGRREMARCDLGGAVDLLDRARALLPAEKPDVSRELGIVWSLMMCGRPAEAMARLTATAAAAERAGDRIGALQARVSEKAFPGSADPGTRLEELRQVLEETRPELERAGDDGALAWWWWGASELAHASCRFGDGAEAARKRLDYAIRSGDPFLASHTAHLAGHLALGPTPIPRALEMFDELEGTAAGPDLALMTMRALLLGYVGRFDEARALAREGTDALGERGMELMAAATAQTSWAIEMAARDVEAAVDAARKSCEALEAMGDAQFLPTNAAQLAESLYVLGDDDGSRHWLQRALDLGDPDDALTQAQAKIVRALLQARRGDDRAREDAETALRITAAMQAPQIQGEIAMHAATVLRSLGDGVAAEERLRQALDQFTAKGSTVYIHRATAALDSTVGS